MNDPWEHLRRFTAARIALGRAGGSLPTIPLLDFRLSHARAKDAVLMPFEAEELATTFDSAWGAPILLKSRAHDREEYLRRPDFGRRLEDHSRETLTAASGKGADLVIVLSDGLSARAVMEQAVPVLRVLLPLLQRDGWSFAPLCIVKHGRVAIQDEIGVILGTKLSLMLLGERPGLGSPDSLGAYFTHQPSLGRTDADRNCVSNIRPAGLAPSIAASKLHTLLNASRHLGLSGIGLKDEAPVPSLNEDTTRIAVPEF